MYIGVKQQEKFFVFFITLIAFLLILAFTFFLSSDSSEEFLQKTEPRNIVLSNLGENSVSISWITDVSTDGYVALYKDGERIGEFKSLTSKKNTIHYVNISDLKHQTTYEFEIYSAEERRLDDGSRYSFSTKIFAEREEVPNFVEGFVEGEGVLIFVLVDNVSPNVPASIYVPSSGSWRIDLSNIFVLDDEEIRGDTPLKVLLHGEKGGKVFRGLKNSLFVEDVVFDLDGDENVFLHLSDFAKLKEQLSFETEEVILEVEEELEEEVLGIEEEVDTFEWGRLN